MEPTDIPGQDLRSFKTKVKRRTLRLTAAALIVVVIFNKPQILYGLVFGACIGFINLNLMFHNLKRVGSSPGKAGVRTFTTLLIRFAIIIGAGLAGMYKNFNPWSMLAGFLLGYVSIISVPFTERLKLKFLTSEPKQDA